jgi:hypothetical protein
MNRRARFAAAFLMFPALMLPLCPALRAQVRINTIDWQVSRTDGKVSLPFETIAELKLEPYQNYSNKFRAVVTAQNPSAKPAEGLVIRCALSLHLVKLSTAADPGFWAVPFRVEELRISRIQPGGVYEAKLIHFTLNEQLNKLKNTGFWVDALKLQVMLDPRPGDDPARIMKEAVISIKKP